MAKEIVGERICKQGHLAVSTSAAIFDVQRQQLLLQRRADNGLWCVPGGSMEPGETLSEACAREVLEETGLHVITKRLISIITNPHWLLEYPNGNRLQYVILHFEVETISGVLTLGEETIDLKFFSQSEIDVLQVHPLDRLRIADSFTKQKDTIVHNVFDI